MSTMMMMKTLLGGAPVLEVKAAEDGVGTARVAFAQLEVVDHDGDYTLPGAFEPGQKVKVCQTGHAHGALPIGAGEIVGEMQIGDGLWAVADLKLFTDTAAGKDTHTVLKRLHELGHTQEWSYGYDTIAQQPGTVDGRTVNLLQKQSVYEISPVLRGAGIGTHTLDVKSANGACDACGQAIPKAATDVAEGDKETCPECNADVDGCACADAKGRAEQLNLQWLAMKARRTSRRPVH